MRRRIRGDVIRRAVILKLPDDHKTAPIGIYHLGAYYRRVNPRGWKRRANEPEAPMIISRRHLAALTSNRDYRRTLSNIFGFSPFPFFFFFKTQTIPFNDAPTQVNLFSRNGRSPMGLVRHYGSSVELY